MNPTNPQRQLLQDVAPPAAGSPPTGPTTDALTNIVSNIPLQTQSAPAASPHQDGELNKIMHDAGETSKELNKKPPQPAVAKPPKASSAPVLVITLTIAIAGALIAAAYYAYK